jgi:hypothetical protein
MTANSIKNKILRHLFFGIYTCRELADLHTTMYCLMKTTSLLMAYKPSQTICATRNVLASFFEELVCLFCIVQFGSLDSFF